MKQVKNTFPVFLVLFLSLATFGPADDSDLLESLVQGKRRALLEISPDYQAAQTQIRNAYSPLYAEQARIQKIDKAEAALIAKLIAYNRVIRLQARIKNGLETFPITYKDILSGRERRFKSEDRYVLEDILITNAAHTKQDLEEEGTKWKAPINKLRLDPAQAKEDRALLKAYFEQNRQESRERIQQAQSNIAQLEAKHQPLINKYNRLAQEVAELTESLKYGGLKLIKTSYKRSIYGDVTAFFTFENVCGVEIERIFLDLIWMNGNQEVEASIITGQNIKPGATWRPHDTALSSSATFVEFTEVQVHFKLPDSY